MFSSVIFDFSRASRYCSWAVLSAKSNPASLNSLGALCSSARHPVARTAFVNNSCLTTLLNSSFSCADMSGSSKLRRPILISAMAALINVSTSLRIPLSISARDWLSRDFSLPAAPPKNSPLRNWSMASRISKSASLSFLAGVTCLPLAPPSGSLDVLVTFASLACAF